MNPEERFELPDRRGQRGLALLMVLWVIVLVGVLAAGFASRSKTDLHLSRNISASAEARHMADAGAELAAFWLAERAQGRLHRGDLSDDGAPIDCRIGEVALRVRIQDEIGKVSLNDASEDLLGRLFMAAGVSMDHATSLAGAVADFRDADDLRRLHGAESDDYAALGLDAPKNARFESVEELAGVAGMTPDLLAQVVPHLTPHSNHPGVDRDTATALARIAASDALLGDGVTPPAPDEVNASPRFRAMSDKTAFAIDVAALTPEGGRFVRRAVIRLAPAVLFKVKPDLRRAPFQVIDWRAVPMTVAPLASPSELPAC